MASSVPNGLVRKVLKIGPLCSSKGGRVGKFAAPVMNGAARVMAAPRGSGSMVFRDLVGIYLAAAAGSRARGPVNPVRPGREQP